MKIKKILAVDNSPVILEFMETVLREEGHEVKTAVDGLSALDILETYSPDVIFVDLVMSNIDGAKLCKIISGMESLKDTYRVILSATAAEQQVDITALCADAAIAKGPIKEMAEHILYVLKNPDRAASECSKGKMIGFETIFSRGVTKELLSVKKHFELILETMSEGVMEITSEGRILYANPTVLSMVEIPEEQLLGAHFGELFAPDEKGMIEDVLVPIGQDPETINAGLPVNLNDRQVTVDFLPIKDEKNTAIIIITDVTEQKKKEAELLRSQKLESIGIIAGGIAHDFNNLLTGILGYTELARMDRKLSNECKDYLSKAIESCMQGQGLTKRMITFSKGGDPVKTRGSLSGVIHDSLNLVALDSGVDYKFNIPDNLWPVEFDEGQMKHVFRNLITNAHEAISRRMNETAESIDAGTIKLNAANITIGEERNASAKAVQTGQYVQISIHDQGIGIPEENLSKIFDLYFTTKEKGSQRGMGFGLAIVYSIIQRHGGYITVDSKAGAGSTFRVYLPATES